MLPGKPGCRSRPLPVGSSGRALYCCNYLATCRGILGRKWRNREQHPDGIMFFFRWCSFFVSYGYGAVSCKQAKDSSGALKHTLCPMFFKQKCAYDSKRLQWKKPSASASSCYSSSVFSIRASFLKFPWFSSVWVRSSSGRGS